MTDEYEFFDAVPRLWPLALVSLLLAAAVCVVLVDPLVIVGGLMP